MLCHVTVARVCVPRHHIAQESFCNKNTNRLESITSERPTKRARRSHRADDVLIRAEFGQGQQTFRGSRLTDLDT